jgi:hypothetical protein
VPAKFQADKNEYQMQVNEIINKQRKQMNDLTMRMFLRTTICFKDIGVFSANEKIYGD